MQEDPDAFEKAARSKPPGLWRELWALLRANKKWWMLPIFIVLFLLSLLVLLAGTGFAPFIYTLF